MCLLCLKKRTTSIMDVQIQQLTPQDTPHFEALIKIFAEVFEMPEFPMPGSAYLNQLLSKPDFLVLVAKQGETVVGGLTVYILHRYYTEKPVAYIYDLGVAPDQQRKGIGKKLIAYLLEYCREQGFEDAYVAAEADDEQAVNFYRATPAGEGLEVVHFTYTLD